MTLNITLLTARTIYQSADFRLTDPNTGEVITDNSTKVVSLQYPDWYGFVTYTGVGRWQARDTSLWIVDWLQGSHDAQLDDVASLLVSNGTKWLEGIKRATGKWYKHTFPLVAFTESGPILKVISNFEDTQGQNDPAPAKQLSVSTRNSRGRISATVTGWKPAVSRQQRRALERLAEQHPEDSGRLRHALSSLNETAARSLFAQELISSECTVLSLGADGQGFQDVSEASNIEPRSIMNGIPSPDIKSLIGQLGGSGKTWKFRSGSFGSSTPRQPDLAPCRPRLVSPSASAGYELIELTHPDFETATAQAINERGVVLGAGTKEGNRGEYYPWLWTPEAGVTTLPLMCGGSSVGMGLNDAGAAALSVATSDGSGHACRWDGATAIDLGTFRGRDSGGRAINNQGVIAGWVCIHPEERGQNNFRPAAWSPQNDMEVLTELPADWGDTVDLDGGGRVLIVAYAGMRSRSLLWEPRASCTQVGGEQGDGVYPVGINDAGTILGFVNDSNYLPVALISAGGGPWQRLGTDPGWYVNAINANGDVVGTFRKDGFERPWLRHSSGEVVMLPYFAYHYCRPFGLNSRGDVIGRATTDHGTHALLWRAQD